VEVEAEAKLHSDWSAAGTGIRPAEFNPLKPATGSEPPMQEVGEIVTHII
jgi:hypothetical protein